MGKFKLIFGVISQIVDTAYFDGLLEAYENSDLLILHVVRFKNKNDREKGILHLTVADAEKIIKHIQPKFAILTHFGMTMIRAKPWEVAKKMSYEIGVQVIAASDGMKFDLNQM